MNKSRTHELKNSRTKRILIVNPFGIGDVLFTTPMVDGIKQGVPDSYIGYICNMRTAPIIFTNTNIDKPFIFEKDEYKALWEISTIRCIKRLYHFLRDLRQERFDIVFDLSLAQEYGLFLKLAGIKERIGYNYRGRGIFLTKKIELPNGYSERHMVDYYIELLQLIGIEPKKEISLKIYIPEEEKVSASEILLQNGIITDEPYICIAPGCGATWGDTAFRKQWMKDGFERLVAVLCNERRIKVVLIGNNDDKAICDYLKERQDRCINLCGKTSLLTFAAIIAKSKLLVTNDGGALHIAVACNTKTVSIFGPVDENVYGPYPSTEDHIVIKNGGLDCRPCYKNFKMAECSHRSCLNKISAEEVIDAVGKSYKLAGCRL